MLISRERVRCIVAMLIAMAVILSGCHKSEKAEAEQAATLKHEQELKKQKDIQRLSSLPSTKLTLDAAKFLWNLKQKGELPGADLKKMLMGPRNGEDVPTNYPASRTFSQKLPDGRVNHYTVSKDLPDTQWKLGKAWQTDSSSNVVQEFPVMQNH